MQQLNKKLPFKQLQRMNCDKGVLMSFDDLGAPFYVFRK